MFVCSTWRAVSRSDLLWQNLTRRIWNRGRLLHPSWRDEFIFRHRTSNNFRMRRYEYTPLHFVPADDGGDNNNHIEEGLSCSRLAISDNHLAAGFSDGSIRLFHLPSRLHVSTFRTNHRNRLGRFSRAISGIILSDDHLVFAAIDGYIHVALTNNTVQPRISHSGDVFRDGALVDFSGCNRWWVGLYAGTFNYQSCYA
ncbi:hypothetical protein U1Q18_001056 [Sarracenia purpurea var. burkii]